MSHINSNNCTGKGTIGGNTGSQPENEKSPFRLILAKAEGESPASKASSFDENMKLP